MIFEVQKFKFLSEIQNICQADDDDICVIQINELVTILNLAKKAIQREIDLKVEILKKSLGPPLGVLNQKLIFPKQIIDLQTKCIIQIFEDCRISIANNKLYVFKGNQYESPNFLQIGQICEKHNTIIYGKEQKIPAFGIRDIVLEKYIVFEINDNCMKLRNTNGKENLLFNKNIDVPCSFLQGYKQNQFIIYTNSKGIICHQIKQKLIRKIDVIENFLIVTDGKLIVLKHASFEYKVYILDIIALKIFFVYNGSDSRYELNLSKNRKFAFWTENKTICSIKLS